MHITVNPDLKAYIDPLTPDEYDALERSILSEGCRDALVLWGDVLVDGHNRHGICQKHGVPFQTVQNTHFQSMEDVHLWMIDQHLGRRSVSDFQRGVLALRKREILAGRRSRFLASTPSPDDLPPDEVMPTPAPDAPVAPPTRPLHSREDIAKAARLSSSQVVQIEKIQKQAAPELVQALKAGAISLNAAAAVASLPADEQVAAALAGKDELKLAAKRARDARRKPPEASDDTPATSPSDELATLRVKVGELEADNAALRDEVAALRSQLEAQSA
ncbi:plasmid replication/partition related protein [Hydrogenophaga sp.]|uniref:plasmid replication/partition related protein n=1 Tax=Hydrogenophaga sp. TaxID=1904254 RepID=UPI00271A995E|nr:plasmid replication/partition related protein [Hydrogenophaga sp.]MDO9506863.1 plasmid replication/partition related protein [Hydrogenophaga sp.]MDP2986915.1 plasmid replication/partition related protein [Hydrogenophaga sp.]MDP3626389.1 plasmid replication/partition related protein [Hydrogenophaga sp.]